MLGMNRKKTGMKTNKDILLVEEMVFVIDKFADEAGSEKKTTAQRAWQVLWELRALAERVLERNV